MTGNYLIFLVALWAALEITVRMLLWVLPWSGPSLILRYRKGEGITWQYEPLKWRGWK